MQASAAYYVADFVASHEEVAKRARNCGRGFLKQAKVITVNGQHGRDGRSLVCPRASDRKGCLHVSPEDPPWVLDSKNSQKDGLSNHGMAETKNHIPKRRSQLLFSRDPSQPYSPI
jgi:hypothetical protein